MNLKIISVISAAVFLMTQITACSAPVSTTTITKQTSRATSTQPSATTTSGTTALTALGGILVCDVSSEGSYYTDASKTNSYERILVRIIQIDPVTGASKVIHMFSNQKSHCAFDLPNTNSMLLFRQIFNSSYDKLAATIKNDKDGATHVGWIDDKGDFTDISAKITSAGGDFSGVVLHSRPRFGPNEFLYYYDAKKAGGLYVSDLNASIKRVPSSNPSAGAVELMDDSVSNNTYLINPDGSAHDGASVFYSDSTMQYCARADMYDWIDQKIYIGQYYQQKDQIFFFYAQPAQSFDPLKFIGKQPLLPDVPNRVNFNGVVSPDRSQVAFLSYLSTGTESPSLYVVSRSGGEPKKVLTDYKFKTREIRSIQLIAWK